MKKFSIILVFLMVLGFTNQVFALDSKSATTCANWKVTSGTPQGGTAWESLRLDISSHPEIQQYRIQWFNGSWSDWYVPGTGDLDSKTNSDGTQRLLWSYFQDHYYETRICAEYQTQATTVRVVTPNGGETYVVKPDNITYKNWLTYKINILPKKSGTLFKYIVKNLGVNNTGLIYEYGGSNYDMQNLALEDSGGVFGNVSLPTGSYYIMAKWKSNDGTENIVDFSDSSFTIINPNTTTAVPYVNLKINGSHNPSAVEYNSVMDVTWDSNLDYCIWYGNYVKNTAGTILNSKSQHSSISGNEKVYAALYRNGGSTPEHINPLMIGVQCWSNDGVTNVSDSIDIPVTQTVTVIPTKNPSVTVLTPNGRENYKPGDKITIRWKTSNIPYNPGTQVDIMDDRITGWSTASLFGTVPALDYAKLVSSSGNEYTYEYTFIIPQNFNGSLPAQYKGIFGGLHYKVNILVSNKDQQNGAYQRTTDDLSDTFFNIQETSTRSITVLSPNGGENYTSGQQITIKWTSKGIPSNDNNFHLVVSKAYTTERLYLMGHNDVTSKTTNDGIETVTLPQSLAPGLYKIEISRLGSGLSDYDVYDDSDGGFNVTTYPVKYPTISSTPTAIAYPNQIPTPTAPIIKTLRPGIKNDSNVRVLQQALIKQGYLQGVADGSYGPKTFRAVQNFQLKNKLIVDGLVGKTTWGIVNANVSTTTTTTGTTSTTGTTTTTNQFPAGCTSNRGYSSTTGQSCSGTTTTTTNCTSNSTPWIKILSPNGGTTYTDGQKIEVKWTSCNIPSNKYLNILANVSSMGWDIGLIHDDTINDGSEVITLPSISTVPSLVYGNLFKIKIQITDNMYSSQDLSDDFFTINATPIVRASCTDYSLVSGSPQGGTGWESLHLDVSKHPEICQYRIQWFNGSWSDWYTPGLGDKDSKTNNDGTERLLWSYFQDHNWEKRLYK